MLAAGAGSAKGVLANIFFIDVYRVNFVDLGHDRYSARRRMNSALGFSFWYALHSVGTRLKFQLAIDFLTLDARNDFLKAAVRQGLAHYFTPNPCSRQTCCTCEIDRQKNCGFIAPVPARISETRWTDR